MTTLTETNKTPWALYALAIGAFGIGTSEFVIMGLLLEVSKDLGISVFHAGMLITGYALGVVVGAPLLSLFASKFPKKNMLLTLMGIFTLGNLLCAIAPNYEILMISRIITSFSHGAFFGIGAIVATTLVPEHKKASAIALMFSGLTIANIMGVPAGTWIGQHFGWRATFWAITIIGPIALATLAYFLPRDTHHDKINIKAEVAEVIKLPVILGLLTTTFGFAGVFAVLTYIAPYLTQLVGFSDASISPLLVLLGAGLIVGNILGGKIADKNLRRALYVTLGALGVVLLTLSVVSISPWMTVAALALFGITGFATVPAFQMNVLSRANKAATLASALNISAFNLGNALGAWAGGLVVASGISLSLLPIVAAGFAFTAIVVVWVQSRLEKADA